MKRRTDEEISAPLYAYDADIRAQYGCFAGVDEAGRGPLCGPVCVAACILDPEAPVYGINDSKKLSEKKREALFDQIVEKALAYRIIFVGPDIIDRDNILNATMGGMRQAVEGLDIVPNLVLVDGNRIPAGLTMPAQPVVKGDATSASIGAASILAKVSRDRYMLELDKQYPQYQLAKHKGYGTKLHYELIAQYGIQPFYRRSFLKKQGYWPEGKMDRAGTGRRGEAAAARFYEKQGAALITHNYHTRMGEIDLILREPDGTLVFCEVKTRAKDSLDTPAAAVNAAKQRRIIASAASYLQSTHQSDEPVRFDVAEVVPLDSGRWMVHIIKGAFCAK